MGINLFQHEHAHRLGLDLFIQADLLFAAGHTGKHREAGMLFDLVGIIDTAKQRFFDKGAHHAQLATNVISFKACQGHCGLLPPAWIDRLHEIIHVHL